jgi:hypothetical protein
MVARFETLAQDISGKTAVVWRAGPDTGGIRKGVRTGMWDQGMVVVASHLDAQMG